MDRLHGGFSRKLTHGQHGNPLDHRSSLCAEHGMVSVRRVFSRCGLYEMGSPCPVFPHSQIIAVVTVLCFS
jgi:hypothetical protein